MDHVIPPMFHMGQIYLTVGGDRVFIVGLSNQGTNYETAYSIDSGGRAIHRYNRRDHGRVTGTDRANPDPENLVKLW